MNESDKTAYVSKYNKRFEQFGNDPRTLGWGGGASRQDLRFKSLTEIGVGPQDSVADIGCGFGDMYSYLQKQGYSGHYCGIDINPLLVEEAQKQHQSATFRCQDILETPVEETYDWVLASGVFNAKLKHEDHMAYVLNMIANMYKVANKGVAIDFMTTYVDYQQEGSFHLNPAEAIKISKLHSRYGVVRMDYLPYEFALYIFKKD